MHLLSQVDGVQFPVEFCAHMAAVKPVGFHDQPICEASDAGNNAAYLVDGMAGNTNFPHGNIKVLATVGEVDPTTGAMLTGCTVQTKSAPAHAFTSPSPSSTSACERSLPDLRQASQTAWGHT